MDYKLILLSLKGVAREFKSFEIIELINLKIYCSEQLKGCFFE